MRFATRTLICGFLGSFAALSAFAASEVVSETTLETVLESMSPVMTAHALQATIVRTTYEPQTLDAHDRGLEAKVLRTVISEVAASSDGVREAVRDAWSVKDGVKQHAFYYANAGGTVQTYDARNRLASTRPSPQVETNHLAFVFDPLRRVGTRKFASRSAATLPGRLRKARVTKRTVSMVGGYESVAFEGEYEDSDPERTFSVIVIPAFSNAVAELKEYGVKGRILTDLSTEGFVNVGDGLWLPETTRLERFLYDDHEGDSVQLTKSEILEPKLAVVGERTFVLDLPKGVDAPRINIDKASRDLFKAMEEGLDALPAYDIPRERKGKAILARAQEAYAPAAERKTIEMPQSSTGPHWATMGIVFLCAAVGVGFLIRFMLLRRQCAARREGQGEERGQGDSGK